MTEQFITIVPLALAGNLDRVKKQHRQCHVSNRLLGRSVRPSQFTEDSRGRFESIES